MKKNIEHEIPFLNFPSDLEIKIIPPIGGATIRFVAKKNNKIVSIYLDMDNNLGLGLYPDLNNPYWEIYPVYVDNEPEAHRYALNDAEGLMQGIKQALGS